MSGIDQAAVQDRGGVRERPDRTSRVITDEDGHVWRVREIRFVDTAPSLIFESELGFRRVRAYPADWRTLAEAELYALSWNT